MHTCLDTVLLKYEAIYVLLTTLQGSLFYRQLLVKPSSSILVVNSLLILSSLINSVVIYYTRS